MWCQGLMCYTQFLHIHVHVHIYPWSGTYLVSPGGFWAHNEMSAVVIVDTATLQLRERKNRIHEGWSLASVATATETAISPMPQQNQDHSFQSFWSHESRYLSKTQFSCGIPDLMPSCSQLTEGVLRWEGVQQGSKFYQLRCLTLFHEIFQQTQRLHTCNVIVCRHTHTQRERHTHLFAQWWWVLSKRYHCGYNSVNMTT